MHRFSSILDYQQDVLSPDIWNPRQQMRMGIKSFILSSLDGLFDSLHIEGKTEFVSDILIGSSLATYFYKDDSDLDIKVVVDLEKFRVHNPHFSTFSDEDLLEFLINVGRENVWTTAVIPGTMHPMDFYFYSIGEINPLNLIKYDSLYSCKNDEWIKEPKKLPEGLSPAFILDQAKQKAQPYLDHISLNIARAKRDTIDFFILIDYLKGLDVEDIGRFSSEISKALEQLNIDLAKLLSDREVVKLLRKRAFTKEELTSELENLMQSLNYSDENIVFKLLQRYGYVRILQGVYSIFKDKKLTEDEIKELESLLYD